MDHDTLMALLEQIRDAVDERAICDALLRIGARYGLTQVLCGVVPAEETPGPDARTQILFNRWPHEWLLRYFDEGHVHKDPVIHRVLTTENGFRWSEAIAQAPSPAADQLFGAAREHGLVDGIAIPVVTANGARGSLSLGGERIALTDKEIGMLEVAANLAVECSGAVEMNRKSARELGLSAREYDCLRWTAEGKTDRDIADLMGLAVRTIEDHGAALRRKLNAINRAHLVTRGFRAGLLR
ncbi:helix-turn-helix transcriptional regulator [Stappia stellulata]|uniref:helix-turn-helix transcriptional regulator n=1 Tax=Stappia stellulata TaxID=71235 RepID=UPI0004901246|nr:LuxR family transcriptional regulator [Stappia stellulata]